MRATHIFIAAVMAAVSGSVAQAQAPDRPQSPALTCAQATALVQGRGALILGTGGYTYDRYVSSQASCQVDEYAEAAFVPTRDNPQCQAGFRCRGRTSRAGSSN